MELTGAKQTNISNHLRVLRDAGIVRPEPHGRFTYYLLVADALAALAGQLGALAAAAEGLRRRPCP